MKKVYILIVILLITNLLTWRITRLSTTPERIEIVQYKEIVKHKYRVKELETIERERMIIRIPFTKFGLSKDLVIGGVVGFLIGL